MLIAQTLSTLTVSLCLLIDNIVIGRFLGVKALAAYGMANPVLLILAAVASMLSAGVQVSCSKSLGRGLQEECNEAYSSSIGITALISIPFMILVFFLRDPIATMLGAGADPELFADTSQYIAGFIIGAPASMAALILVPFLQIAGQSTLLVIAVAGMTVADIALDLLNVYVFHGGMFGMGLASSISYYVGCLVGIIYFVSKKSVFKFSFKRIKAKKMGELFKGGLPSIFNLATIVVLVFVLNNLLLNVSGDNAVAAFSVIQTLGNASNCITTGIGGVTLTMVGIMFQEEDRGGLRKVINQLYRYAVILGIVVGGLLIGFAPLLVRLFIPEAGASQDMAIQGIRMFALGLVPSCFCGALRNAYQAIGHPVYTEVISLFEGAGFPILVAWILSFPFKATGVWYYFLAGEVLTLLGICIFCWIQNREIPFKNMGMLLLGKDFSVPAEETFEATVTQLEDAIAVSEKVGEFCRSRGASSKVANRIAVCVEEMSTNTVEHGFTKDKKKNHSQSVLILHKKDKWIVRFRDDCTAFDPIHYVPKTSNKDCLGIRLVLAIADDVKYTYSLNLNNLAITIHESELENAEPITA